MEAVSRVLHALRYPTQFCSLELAPLRKVNDDVGALEDLPALDGGRTRAASILMPSNTVSL
jgi:hypothetical protein